MLQILIILTLCFLATAKVTVQSSFAGQSIKTLSDNLFFNGVIFLGAALFFIPKVWDANLLTLLFGLFFGTFTVVFQTVYVKAMHGGNTSMAVMISNLSMIVPLFFSVLVYREPFPFTHMLGLVLSVAAVVVSAIKGRGQKGGRVWLVYSLIAAFVSGSLAVSQKIYSNLTIPQSEAFVAVSYLSAFLTSLLLYVILLCRRKPKTFRMTVKGSCSGFGAGVLLGLYVYLNTYAIAHIDGAVLFPSVGGGIVIMSTLSCLLILKERLKKNKVIGLILGILAIVLLNLP